MEVTPERIEYLKSWTKIKLVRHIVKLEKTVYLIEKDYEVKRKEEKKMRLKRYPKRTMKFYHKEQKKGKKRANRLYSKIKYIKEKKGEGK